MLKMTIAGSLTDLEWLVMINKIGNRKQGRDGMNMSQKSTEFEPITITLENMEDVAALWDLCIWPSRNMEPLSSEAHSIANSISDYFTMLDLKHRD